MTSSRTDPSPTPDGRHGHFTAVLNDQSDVPEVRRAVRQLAIAHGFADRAADLSLALDELLANAHEHGNPPVRVETWYDGRIILEVSDQGEGFPARLPSTLPAPGSDSGRGLWIVRQITDHVEIGCSGNGTTVRVELSHEPHIGA